MSRRPSLMNEFELAKNPWFKPGGAIWRQDELKTAMLEMAEWARSLLAEKLDTGSAESQRRRVEGALGLASTAEIYARWWDTTFPVSAEGYFWTSFRAEPHYMLNEAHAGVRIEGIERWAEPQMKLEFRVSLNSNVGAAESPQKRITELVVPSVVGFIKVPIYMENADEEPSMGIEEGEDVHVEDNRILVEWLLLTVGLNRGAVNASRQRTLTNLLNHYAHTLEIAGGKSTVLNACVSGESYIFSVRRRTTLAR